MALATFNLTDYSTDLSGLGKTECLNIQSMIETSDFYILPQSNNVNHNQPPKVFAEYRGKYHTQQYVGMFKYNSGDDVKQIIIDSRFAPNTNLERPSYFLQYIVENAFDYKNSIWGGEEFSSKNSGFETLYDFLLMTQYIQQLQTAFKKGYYKKYVTFEQNNDKLQGRIDIARHIKLNMRQQNGKIAYSQRTYSIANEYNELFLRAFETMRKKYPRAMRSLLSQKNELKHQLNALRNENPAYMDIKNSKILSQTNKRITHPVYKAYEPLRETARLILRKEKSNIFKNGEIKTTGFLLDMNRLWELYLTNKIFNQLPGWKSQETQKPPIKIFEKHRTIKPDFLYEKSVDNETKSYPFVLDAKYKKCWGETLRKDNQEWNWFDAASDSNGNDSDYYNHAIRSDSYQVMAYMLALNCKDGGVIFPVDSSSKSCELDNKICVSDFQTDKFFHRIAFPVSFSGNDYDAYKNEMHNREIDLINFLQEYYTTT